jgi:hypothetical protein
MSLSSDSLFYCLTLSMYVVSQGVRFSDNEMEETSFGDTLVIINCSTELKDQIDHNPKTGILEDLHFLFFHFLN